MNKVVMSGTGMYLPPDIIHNEELAASYNAYVQQYNERHKQAISKGTVEALKASDADFIAKASGIRQRHVFDKKGILNNDFMHPLVPLRSNDEPSIQCEMAVQAAKQALTNANKTPADINGIIVACSNMQRAYPAIAIEVQDALGINGFAYDLNVACSSASFSINVAYGSVASDMARCMLVVHPEIYTGHLNFRDRTSHFIFGDACSAAVIENQNDCTANHPYEILGCQIETQFSNNIRNNFGFLNRCEKGDRGNDDTLFVQNGKKVREEVVGVAANHIFNHLMHITITPTDIQRLWLHQANIHINQAIAQKVLNREYSRNEVPLILEKYGNTGASGVMIAYHETHRNLHAGEVGVLCSFGAGYAVGSVILQKL
jgi:beta-ketodecanoyl-[acyl-carrier-protein] synthase